MTSAPPHPAFPQPSDLNATIWRYVDLSKFDDLVTASQLYMRRADLLDDEFEGTTPAAELARWDRLVEEASNDDERRAIQAAREQQSEFARVFRPMYYLTCWCMSLYENVAMWERYVKSSSTEGVAIRSTFAALTSQLANSVTYVGLVRYIDYDRDDFARLTMNVMHRIMHKRIFFIDEREVRGVVSLWSHEPLRQQYIDPFLTADKKGLLAKVNPKELIDAVVLHPRTTAAFADKVSELCSRYGLSPPIRSAMSSAPQF
jgi:hypothetical protein